MFEFSIHTQVIQHNFFTKKIKTANAHSADMLSHTRFSFSLLLEWYFTRLRCMNQPVEVETRYWLRIGKNVFIFPVARKLYAVHIGKAHQERPHRCRFGKIRLQCLTVQQLPLPKSCSFGWSLPMWSWRFNRVQQTRCTACTLRLFLVRNAQSHETNACQRIAMRWKHTERARVQCVDILLASFIHTRGLLQIEQSTNIYMYLFVGRACNMSK